MSKFSKAGLTHMANQVEQYLVDLEVPIEARLSRLTSEIVATIMILKLVNISELAKQLPRQTKNVKGHEMAIYRILKPKRVVPNQVMKPFSLKIIKKAAAKGKTVVLAIDQTQTKPEFQCLAIGVKVANSTVL